MAQYTSFSQAVAAIIDAMGSSGGSTDLQPVIEKCDSILNVTNSNAQSLGRIETTTGSIKESTDQLVEFFELGEGE